MASCSSFNFLLEFWLCIIIIGLSDNGHAQLDATFYDDSCPELVSIVNAGMKQAIGRESRLAASILRNYFHDCFVSGCDASILLDGKDSEKFAFPNLNTARGFEVIDDIKKDVEEACPKTVSCADILSIATREGVREMQGPSWELKFGRKDSLEPKQEMANNGLPGPSSTLGNLKEGFGEKGFTPTDVTALSGAHTIEKNKKECPFEGGDFNVAQLDQTTPLVFDNQYYKNLMERRVLLDSDQVLFSNDTQDDLVTTYSKDQDAFFKDFAQAMVKLSNLSPLTGDQGEIRTNCRSSNSEPEQPLTD
ncbi:Peroxidase [Zostera marina]|uniref:Peroxidase n=1 Tax=Zostera marina TaxID=29655 RepID=A0A0K9NRY7_ZOSMR|nr:Peroxidase [Zostera marina]